MDIEPLNDKSIKFNTCKHRSIEQQTKTIKRCSCQGGNYTIEGYLCEARQIFDIKPEICEQCPIYESK